MGSPSLHLLNYKLVVLQPLYPCFFPFMSCFLPYPRIFYRYHLVLSLLFFIQTETSPSYSSLQRTMWAYQACLTSFDRVGTMGLLRSLFLLLSINFFQVGLLGLLSYSFFLGLIHGPFLLLKECHLIVANSSTLPIYRNGLMCLIICSFMGIPSLWALVGAMLIHFLGLRGCGPIALLLLSNFSFFFLDLVWAFLPLGLRAYNCQK